MRWIGFLGVLAVWWLALAEAQTIPATSPANTMPVDATIHGKIISPSPISKLAAVDRNWANPLTVTTLGADAAIYPGTIDAKTGAFTVPGLLPGRTYDLILLNDQGRWEGATMDYHRPIIPNTEFTAEDKQWIEDFISKTPEFYDKCRVMRMAADHQHATVLVELIRTRDFYHGGAGDIIYRVELWYFENLFGGWAKDKNTEKVLVRWRGPGDKIPRNWQFLPELGGITVGADGTSDAVNVTLPAKADPRHGIADGKLGVDGPPAP